MRGGHLIPSAIHRKAEQNKNGVSFILSGTPCFCVHSATTTRQQLQTELHSYSQLLALLSHQMIHTAVPEMPDRSTHEACEWTRTKGRLQYLLSSAQHFK
jgi:hypothetical protein